MGLRHSAQKAGSNLALRASPRKGGGLHTTLNGIALTPPFRRSPPPGPRTRRLACALMELGLLSGAIFLLSAFSTVVAAESAADALPTRRALLIGINDYKAVPKLQGSINDIETMRQILVTRWGFSDTNITLIKDSEATRAGMLAALNRLATDAGPADTVYVHYSGHGSQVQDLNGDEKDDGLDETLVPQDGRTEGVPDIIDDELDAIFARLRARSVMIVLDSCHSGTATRSARILTRSVPQDQRVDLYRSLSPGTRGIVPAVTSRFVVMTGAASNQEALDGPVDGRSHGFFTYALSKSLSGASENASPRDVFDGVERELKRIQTQFGRSSMPEPQLEAPPQLLDQPIFPAFTAGAPRPSGAVSDIRLPWIEVQPAGDDRVLLKNGLLLSAVPGSLWGIYGPGESAFPIGQALAIATVIPAPGQEIVATIRPSTARIPAGARAVALMPPPAPERVAVQILDVPQEARTQIEQAIRQNVSDVEFVAPDKVARFLVDVQGRDVRLLGADGLQVVGSYSLNQPDWGDALASAMSSANNATELLTLDNSSSKLRLNVKVSARPVKSQSRGINVVAADTKATRYRVRRADEPRSIGNSLQLEIVANADSYLTILDVDSQGGMNLLFPNEYQSSDFYPAGKVPGGRSILIPDTLGPDNRAGFYWDYVPPTGTDTIRVFSTTDRDVARMLRQRVLALRAKSGTSTRGGATTRAAMTETVGSLRKDFADVATRGIAVVKDKANSSKPSTGQSLAHIAGSDWTAVSVTVLIGN
mgnify:FL=1